ncbi:hypothetical protein MAIT1_00423 [Magnetofaba australis IT-1]|uniref:Uncharacterized protein n=2 Tax=Magnetofaba TaxID=1472292 RepID=A0A1Y2JYQ3_9PROT|nr:hypothetical protein MAIT1_00423 [Magnetofaba australis IT-1]
MVFGVIGGWMGMHSPFALQNPMLVSFIGLGAVILASFVRNTATLLLAASALGFSAGPIIAYYVGAGMSHIVGQAAFMTGAAFGGLSMYALTTKRDLSMLGGMLMAGVIVLIVGGLLNAFLFQSGAMQFAMAAMGAVIFSGIIVWETQQLKNQPWAIPPGSAALSMYINLFNLFISLLQILGIMGGDD